MKKTKKNDSLVFVSFGKNMFFEVSLCRFFFFFGCGTPSRSVEEMSSEKNNKYDEAIRLGGEWFLNNQNDDFLFYEYDLQKRNIKIESAFARNGSIVVNYFVTRLSE